ncbi:Hypothetical predicted protein [Olea europaea subsp. europaea]|uniref:Uncharacterized protein n=1 Tax=Olea europaea subsp. europaea TaxID=158383 RepID=A0A8S0UP27_OLEEU|nr:Hypothetical predicted protein [Olea europaea subsp. europaea]
MDAVNVFVVNGFDTFGLLVPFGCKYIGLVDKIASELKVDMRCSCVEIECFADVEMSPIRIMNDNSLQFYLELKHRDPRVTAYALRIKLIEMSQSTDFVPRLSNGEQTQVQAYNFNGSQLMIVDLSKNNSMMHDFVPGIEVPALEIEDDIFEEMTDVATPLDVRGGLLPETFEFEDVFMERVMHRDGVLPSSFLGSIISQVLCESPTRYVLKDPMDKRRLWTTATGVSSTSMVKGSFMVSDSAETIWGLKLIAMGTGIEYASVGDL